MIMMYNLGYFLVYEQMRLSLTRHISGLSNQTEK